MKNVLEGLENKSLAASQLVTSCFLASLECVLETGEEETRKMIVDSGLDLRQYPHIKALVEECKKEGI